MGRKIPGRKHRGVRDPEKQRQQRMELIKNKINAPPKDNDTQDIPKSLTRIMDLQTKMQNHPLKKQKPRRKISISSHPAGYKHNPQIIGKLDKKEPIFKIRRNETDGMFMRRVKSTCHSVIQETKFELKYGVKVKYDKEKRNLEVVKAKKDDLEEYYNKVRKEKKFKGKKKKKKNEEIKLTKAEKRKAKVNAKKEKRLLNGVDEFKVYEDQVKFGEIVHEPPKNLTMPRKIQEQRGAPRPGTKNLLLKSIMNGSTNNKHDLKKSPDQNVLHKTANKVIDKKGKRKDLPNALRRQLDKQQNEVIQAYKELKKKKYANV